MAQWRIRWSKIKKQFQAFICPELRERLDFHVTAYRRAHDDAGEGWVSLDGKKIFGCGYCKYLVYGGVYDSPGGWDLALDRRDNVLGWLEGKPAYRQTPRDIHLREVGIHGTHEFVEALRIYPTLPVERALRSKNPFLKVFAIIDRRVGRRTLESLPASGLQHPLVRQFYELRLQAIRDRQQQ